MTDAFKQFCDYFSEKLELKKLNKLFCICLHFGNSNISCMKNKICTINICIFSCFNSLHNVF